MRMTRPLVLIGLAGLILSACAPMPEALSEPVADGAIMLEPAAPEVRRNEDDCAIADSTNSDGIGGTGCPAIE